MLPRVLPSSLCMPLYLVGFVVVRLSVELTLELELVVELALLLRPLFETAHPDFFSESLKLLRS